MPFSFFPSHSGGLSAGVDNTKPGCNKSWPSDAATAESDSGFGGHFLIAMPGSMDDPWFGRSVVYLCEHSARGALGLVINKPTQIRMTDLFTKVDLQLTRTELCDRPVIQGGPINPEQGFVLHERLQALGSDIEAETEPAKLLSELPTYNSTIFVGNALELTTSKDVLEAIANGAGPRQVEVFLGHAAWGPLQLEKEIAGNAWITVPANPDLIFHTPVYERYQAALHLLGIAEWALTQNAGRA